MSAKFKLLKVDQLPTWPVRIEDPKYYGLCELIDQCLVLLFGFKKIVFVDPNKLIDFNQAIINKLNPLASHFLMAAIEQIKTHPNVICDPKEFDLCEIEDIIDEYCDSLNFNNSFINQQNANGKGSDLSNDLMDSSSETEITQSDMCAGQDEIKNSRIKKGGIKKSLSKLSYETTSEYLTRIVSLIQHYSQKDAYDESKCIKIFEMLINSERIMSHSHQNEHFIRVLTKIRSQSTSKVAEMIDSLFTKYSIEIIKSPGSVHSSVLKCEDSPFTSEFDQPLSDLTKPKHSSNDSTSGDSRGNLCNSKQSKLDKLKPDTSIDEYNQQILEYLDKNEVKEQNNLIAEILQRDKNSPEKIEKQGDVDKINHDTDISSYFKRNSKIKTFIDRKNEETDTGPPLPISTNHRNKIYTHQEQANMKIEERVKCLFGHLETFDSITDGSYLKDNIRNMKPPEN